MSLSCHHHYRNVIVMTITVVRYNIVTSTEGNERSIISTPSSVKEPSKYFLVYLPFHGNEAYHIMLQLNFKRMKGT